MEVLRTVNLPAAFNNKRAGGGSKEVACSAMRDSELI